MGIAGLDYKKSGSKLEIDGIIEDYRVYAGKNVDAGDFVEFINTIASSTTATSSDTSIVTTTSSGRYLSAIALDDSRVFIVHMKDNSTYSLNGIVCTVSGATITKGTDTVISSTKNSGMYGMALVLLPNGNVFLAYPPGFYGVICTITGTTITHGTSTTIGGYGYDKPTATLLPDGNVFVATRNDDSNKYLYGQVCTISGTTITKGTYTQLSTTTATGSAISVTTLPSGKVFIAHNYTSSYLYGMICTVSGTTITVNTDTVISTSEYAGLSHSTLVLKNGNVFITHQYGSGNSTYLRGIVCKINGTTITKGPDTSLSNSQYSETTSPVLLDSGKVLVFHSGSYVDSYLYGIVCEISGNVIAKGTDTVLRSIENSADQISAFLLRGKPFVVHSYGSSTYVYAQLWDVDEINNIPTNQITWTEYEMQVQPVTALPCKGVAQMSGIGGDEISVYVNDAPDPPEEPEEDTSGTYVSFTSNPVPTTWTNSSDGKTATATNNYGEWNISASQIYSNGASYVPSNAFDGDTSTYFRMPKLSSDTVYVTLTLNLPNGVTIKPTKISVKSSNMGSSMLLVSKIYGVKSDGGLVEFGTLARGKDTVTNTFTMEPEQYYKGIEIHIYRYSSSYYPYIYDVQIQSGTLRIE